MPEENSEENTEEKEEPWNPSEIAKAEEEYRKLLEKVAKGEKQQSEEEFVPEPTPAEPEHPRAMETTKENAMSNAQVQREEGAVFPQPNIRPQPPQASKEEGSVIVAKALAEQLGTSPELKAEQRIDERKMAVLSDKTLAALSHFSYRFVYDKVRYWGHITEWWLTGSQGIGGLGRRHILQALANTSGVQAIEKAEKPNVIARNVWDRSWKRKATEEGKQVED